MNETLHEDFLKKEDEKDKWVEYWVVLRNCALYFYDEQTELWHEYCDKIELTANARCSVVRRRTYSHRFKLVTEEGMWLLKCHTNLQRHRWMHAIDLAVREISSAPMPGTPRGCYYERDLFGRSMRREIRRQREAACENNNNALEELSLNLDLEKGTMSERQTSTRKTSKLKKSPQKDKESSAAFESLLCGDKDLGSPVENLAFSDEEVGVDGNAKMRSIRSAPVAKLICVESASKSKQD